MPVYFADAFVLVDPAAERGQRDQVNSRKAWNALSKYYANSTVARICNDARNKHKAGFTPF